MKPKGQDRNDPHRNCPYCAARFSVSETVCPSCGRAQPARSAKSWEQLIADQDKTA